MMLIHKMGCVSKRMEENGPVSARRVSLRFDEFRDVPVVGS